MKSGPQNPVLQFAGFRPTGDFGPLTGYTSKRGRAVWYLKAPPKTPPTGYQTSQRNKFRMTALAWNALRPEQRTAWMEAARGAHLHITGFNLFVWYQLRRDHAVIRTVAHQSGIDPLA